ncbi:MAG: glutathione peroxidase [Flavobacteriales bacterium]|nr:glutathione peroxidase [Flavobacteriales bacterium]
MDASEWYKLDVASAEGDNLKMIDFQGKVVLIVNTASKCGYTKQLNAFEELNTKYKERGLVILGFPCNQFGEQEPESNATVAKCYFDNNGVTFQLMEKIEVNGENAHPIYNLLTNNGEEPIKWNFTKFLISLDGTIFNRFSSVIEPKELETTIEKLLN